MGNTKSTKPKLDREMVLEYQKLTKLSEDEIQEWYQEFYKECHDGQLSYLRFRRIFARYFSPAYATAFSDTIFRTFDKDNNKSLEFREFLLALSPPNQLNFKDHITLLIDIYGYGKSKNQSLNEAALERIIKVMFDLADPIDFNRKSDMKIIMATITTKLKRINGTDFDREDLIARCYSNPDLRDLLAPYIPDEKQTPVEPMNTTQNRKLDVVRRDTTNASANQRNINIKKSFE